MDHNIIHMEMLIRDVVHVFWIQKSTVFTILKNLYNDFMHHKNIQVKIFKPNPF
jgi:hypothetical protein